MPWVSVAPLPPVDKQAPAVCGASIPHARAWVTAPTGGIWASALDGSVAGRLGGVVGGYCSIQNSRSPRERALMIGASVEAGVVVALFLGAMWLPPQPYRGLLWLPYSFVLFWGIRTIHCTQTELHALEANDKG